MEMTESFVETGPKLLSFRIYDISIQIPGWKVSSFNSFSGLFISYIF